MAKQQPQSLFTRAKRALSQFPWLGYEGADTSGIRRRSPPVTTSSEDWHANHRRRTVLTANARDLSRNFALAAWAVRRHIAFICDLEFQAKTDDRAFNKDLEQWWVEESKPWNHDVASRHDFKRSLRLAEACRILDGDVGWLKIGGGSNRGLVQAIEGDRIMMPYQEIPDGQSQEEWVNGVRIDTGTGRALAYGICKRVGPTMKQLDRIVPARNLSLHAAYEFRYDQIRGVSPIASALNQFRDCMEAYEFAMAKAKLGQLFGVAITSDSEVSNFGPNAAEYTQDADGDGTNDSAPRINMPKGTFLTELDVGEGVDVIESKTPSTETMALIERIMQLALQSLNIPFSLYSENFANYSGQRGAIMAYLYACSDYIRDVQNFATQHTLWKMGLAVADSSLILPSGKDFDFIRDSFEFVPGAFPYDQPQREDRSTAMEIAMGFNNPYRAAQERGTKFEDNIDKIAQAFAYAESQKVDLTYTDSTLFAPELTLNGSGQGQSDQ